VKGRATAAFAFAVLAFATLVAVGAGAQPSQSPQSPLRPAAVRYVVSLADANNHLVRVRIVLSPGPHDRDLALPVWNALYQIRDFAQYVSGVVAKSSSGVLLSVKKIDKTAWRVSGADNGAEVEYQIFANEPGPFGAQLNVHHAFFNLAQLLMFPLDARASPMRVGFTDIPSGWRIATTLASHPPEDFEAENYDRLVDSPVELGSFQESDFDDGGGHYRVVIDADPADYDMQDIVSDLRRIVSSAVGWMDDRPYSTYLFLYHFPRYPAGSGMEHANCTAIDISARVLADNPQSLADLTAHEFFHLWNVKRIRPKSLEPIDYSQENYSTALWFSEGVTSTAGDLIRLRAGLLDEPRFLNALVAQIAELEQRPAHLTQSAEESSLDAWLEKYPYYRLPDRSISYYNKGDLLGVLLDLQVREASHGSASLRDVFRWMNQNYARKGQFFPDSEGVQQAAEAVSHANLASFFLKYVRGADEIPWDDFFKSVGLRLVRRTRSVADLGFFASRNFDAPPLVAAVAPGSPAERAGLTIGDILLTVDGRKPESDFYQRLARLGIGDTLHLRVRSGGGERDLQWQLTGREEVEFELKDVDNITPQQKARRAAWLKGESQLSGETRP
jgi:predicted metalloprotease with PDZ domain